MKMKKVVSTMLALGMMASLSVGCTQQEEPKNENTNKKQENQKKENEQSKLFESLGIKL